MPHAFGVGVAKKRDRENTKTSMQEPASVCTFDKKVASAIALEKGYNVKSMLGKGTYGHVWLLSAAKDATGEGNRKDVALKVFHHGTEQFASFLREVDALMVVKEHPNVVRIIDAELYHMDRCWVMMELAGRNLSDYRDNLGDDSDAMVAALAASPLVAAHIASALAYLHHHGLAHRDVKPQNILVTVKGGGLVGAKLCDFGLTKPMGCGYHSSGMCSLPYRPPEVLLGSKTYEYSVDMWSLGATIMDFIVSARTFAGATEEEVLNTMESLFATQIVEAPSVALLPAGGKALMVTLGIRTAGGQTLYPPIMGIVEDLLVLNPRGRMMAAPTLRRLCEEYPFLYDTITFRDMVGRDAVAFLSGLVPGGHRKPPKPSLGVTRGSFHGAQIDRIRSLCHKRMTVSPFTFARTELLLRVLRTCEGNRDLQELEKNDEMLPMACFWLAAHYQECFCFSPEDVGTLWTGRCVSEKGKRSGNALTMKEAGIVWKALGKRLTAFDCGCERWSDLPRVSLWATLGDRLLLPDQQQQQPSSIDGDLGPVACVKTESTTERVSDE